ncbi:hypothetical protein LBMAG42_38850 [Deltaproteobacteria bacterium]|nr:hypothetical protein LBMAG42_38850 [Deltaproteobacteria bacterium]
MISLALWLAAANAGDIYLNGVRADVLPVMSMENVTVRFDASGNIWIDAPMYRVSVVPSGAQAPTTALPVAAAPPAAYTPTPAPTYTTSPGYTPVPATTPAYTPSYAPTYSPAPTPAPRATPAPTLGGLAPGGWWLVTEDNDSSGQDIEVLVNGQSVRHVRSGEPQMIVDLGDWLHHGTNTVTLRAAPGTYGGGALLIYVGKGNEAGGTVRMDTPEVRYTRRAVDLGSGGEKSYTVAIP